VAALVVLIILSTGLALLFNKYMCAPAIKERQKDAMDNAKRVAATIAVFPSPLPDHLEFVQAQEFDGIRSFTINRSPDDYPMIDIRVRPKHDDEDFQLEIDARKSTGFKEYKSGTSTFCGKSLPYHLGHSGLLGGDTDSLVGKIVDWGTDEVLDVEVTSKKDNFDLAQIEMLFASLKPSAATYEETVFKANEILSSVKSQLLPLASPGWAASGIIALASTEGGAKQIALMIRKSKAEVSYIVIFPGDQQEYVIGDDDIAHLKGEMPLWRKVLGCAIGKKFPNQEGVYGTRDAWQPAVQTSLESLTGAKIQTTRLDDMTEAALAKTLIEEMRHHEPVLFSTKESGELGGDLSSIFKQSSAYPVLAYDADKSMVSVPKHDLLEKAQKSSNKEKDENKDVAQVPLKELCQFGRFICFPQH